MPVPTESPAGWLRAPAQASLAGIWLDDVVWSGVRFVAAGSDADGNLFFLDSSDGVTWHRQETAGEVDWPVQLAAGPGGVIALGVTGERQVTWVSPDGLTWKARRNAFRTASGAHPGEAADIVAMGHGWLAVGSRVPDCEGLCAPDHSVVWTSDDGLAWTAVADQRALHGGFMTAVARGEEGFVAVGTGTDATAIGGAIWTSADGLRWARVPHDAAFEGPARPDYAAGMTDVAVRDGVTSVVGYAALDDDSSVILTWSSAAGGPWSRVDSTTPADLPGPRVVASPDGFLGVWPGDCPGEIWASTDGGTWGCAAAGAGLTGFLAVAVAASDAVEVTVGMTPDAEDGTRLPAMVWYRFQS